MINDYLGVGGDAMSADVFQPQIDFQVRDVGFAHLRNRRLLTKPIRLNLSADRTYFENEKFWNDTLNQTIRSTFVVFLNRFDLFEWFPRSPGLYYTPNAAYARQEATRHIDTDFPDRSEITRDHASQLHGLSVRDVGRDRKLVFTPAGKFSMLEGGIGNIRFKPIQFPHGIHWFMTASSSGVPDDGIPIALPDDFYPTVSEPI